MRSRETRAGGATGATLLGAAISEVMNRSVLWFIGGLIALVMWILSRRRAAN